MLNKLKSLTESQKSEVLTILGKNTSVDIDGYLSRGFHKDEILKYFYDTLFDEDLQVVIDIVLN